MKPHNWYLNGDNRPKTHKRKGCAECKALGGNGGCALPFRKSIKKRYYKKLDKKPTRAMWKLKLLLGF